ncbi:hypothetical protein GSF04_13970 [Pseudoalteromonas sp. A22]|uniref:hypothetical protein n=1 Tax=Pseudoalteromonas sp. A22 TaxID=327511 RepID=UPI001BA70CC2|nr:hypothetical protein [Pseudoalteromonas sp. A22]QUI63540.1 hypothetical protein GSF04_13970 [Pseudoalteromonas sp. A22]
MKKGLKVSDGFNVNLDNVCVWIVETESIQLQLACSDELGIIDIVIEGSEAAKCSEGHRVTINEFKRIEREITEYMAE